MRKICKIPFGSVLYGTGTPTSDLDFKGVHIPDARDILLQRIKPEIGSEPSKKDGVKNQAGDVEDKSYALHRFLKLLAEGQTGVIDMLFAPNPIETSDLWKHIWDNRYRILNKKSAAFVGYCRQQANKYGVKGDRVEAVKWAMDFFQAKLDEFGATYKVGEALGSGPYTFNKEFTSVEVIETTPNRFETYFICCNKMVGFKNTVKEAAAIYTKIYNEYGDRAKKAQSYEGIDWKALSHSVRVGYEAIELFQTGHIVFPLTKRERILDIKLGKIPFSEVSVEIDQLLIDVESAASLSTLRKVADQEWIDNLIMDEYAKEVISSGCIL